MQFLSRVFGGEASKVPPILVRLRLAGPNLLNGFPEGPVMVEAHWGSAREPQRWQTQAAQGLCIIPWQQGRRVRLRFSHRAVSGELELTHHDAREGSAAELWLG